MIVGENISYHDGDDWLALEIETPGDTHLWVKTSDTQILSVFMTIGTEEKDFSILLGVQESEALAAFLAAYVGAVKEIQERKEVENGEEEQQ